MKRRDFLRNSALMAAATVVPSAWADDGSMGTTPYAVLAQGSPSAAVKAAVDGLGGMSRFVKKGDKVVVKPNMSFSNPPSWATTTHPEVVKELVAQCVSSGASRVLVLDNPLKDVELCLEKSGLARACELFPDTSVLGLQDRKFFREIKVPEGVDLKSTRVMKDVLEADVLISAPVAKCHSSAGVSLSMKNLMGVIYDRAVFHWRYDLHTAIVDLCSAVRPHLSVVDATRLLSTRGPGGPGKVIELNTVIASADFVTADALTVSLGEWYGRKFEPGQVKHIRQAHERGLGRMDIGNLDVKKVSA